MLLEKSQKKTNHTHPFLQTQSTFPTAPDFRRLLHQYRDFNNKISRSAQRVIQEIMDDLVAVRTTPNRAEETEKILRVPQTGDLVTVRRPRIDLFVESSDGTEYYFDLKTAKPNISGFRGYKRQLLEWVAIRGAQDNTANIRTLIAIPYNPYEPEPYQRWTLQGLFDLENEIKVAEEFWNFLGGDNTYEQLLSVFETVGLELRPEIDARFEKFKT
ncbi:TdeIII family type II restriction endonuclease [archaeon]|nr:TdeIII family type II restriction endonuclease [archaeon]